MYPSTEKALVVALKSALADYDSGVSGADERIRLLARGVVEIADEDDVELSRLMAASLAREASVPQAWLQAFAEAYQVDGMPAIDRRAAGIDIWHGRSALWHYERTKHPTEIGRLDGEEQAEKARQFIAERKRQMQT